MITNNGRAIDAERGQGVNVILTGGELRYPKEAMVGDYAIRNLQTVIAKRPLWDVPALMLLWE